MPPPIDPYATHIPILKKLLKVAEVKRVFEFGTGPNSTGLFMEHCALVVSVEQQNHAFAEKFAADHAKAPNLVVKHIPGIYAGNVYLARQKKTFDLIFVDGGFHHRAPNINAAFRKTSIVVAHDTESSSYNWGNVKMPAGWTRIDFKQTTPWTTVWTKDKKVARALLKSRKDK